MKKFSSIDQFKSAVHNVRAYATKTGSALPTIPYAGRLKLHGTNAGVAMREGDLIPMSRNNELTIQNDNAGFAQFVAKAYSDAALAGLIERVAEVNGVHASQVVLFGEWIGPGVQKGVAISELPERQYVLFKAHITKGEATYYIDLNHGELIDRESLHHFNAGNIYFISQILSPVINVDFRMPELATEELERLTLAVEEECPWGKMFGISGIGEGYVWSPVDPELAKHSGLWFKTKGVKHQKSNKTKPTNVVVADPVRVQALNDLVDLIVPEWRLDQGLGELSTPRDLLTNHNIGEYLKWVMTDTLKEETDTIANNEFDWKKDISKAITLKARLYFAQNVQ